MSVFTIALLLCALVVGIVGAAPGAGLALSPFSFLALLLLLLLMLHRIRLAKSS